MRLQFPHRSCRFSMWSVPPLDLGMMWSISRCWSSKWVLHPLQFPACCPYRMVFDSASGGAFPMSVRSGRSARSMMLNGSSWLVSGRSYSCRSLECTSSTALWLMSIPIQFRFSFSAATHAVAHPQNGSSTMSPSLLDALMILSSSASGF